MAPGSAPPNRRLLLTPGSPPRTVTSTSSTSDRPCASVTRSWNNTGVSASTAGAANDSVAELAPVSTAAGPVSCVQA